MPRRLLAYLALLLLLLGAVGVQVYRSQLQLAKTGEQEQLLSIARLKVERITAWRRERLGDGVVLSANRRLMADIGVWLKTAADDALRADFTAVLEAMQRHYGYRDYLLVDAAGRVRLQSGTPSAAALQAKAEAALMQARRSREPQFTDLHTDDAFPYPHLGLVIPIDQGKAPAGGGCLTLLALAGAVVGLAWQRRQRKLATAQAEASRRQHLILTGATDGLWDWNLVTGEDFHSARYQELLGYGPGELPDTAAGFEAIVHPDDLPRVKAAQQAHLERREPYQVELRLRTKSGDYRWFVSRGQAEWDTDGQPLCMAGFITDITERKALESALIDLNTHLEQKVAERTAELAQRTAELARTGERLDLAMQVTSDEVWDCNMQTE